MKPWWKIEIYFMAFPGRFVWISLEDRGCNQGRYPVRTIGMDGVSEFSPPSVARIERLAGDA